MDKKINVLIIDDDKNFLSFLTFRLKNAGYNPIHFEESISALKYINKNYNTIDIILLDLKLPSISGTDILLLLRKFKIKRIPVIIISATTSESSIVKHFNIGADDYLCKPISIKELQARIKNILSHVHGEQQRL